MKLSPKIGSRILADYGMFLVLIVLGVFFSAVTLSEQQPTGPTAALQVVRQIEAGFSAEAGILIPARDLTDDAAFAAELVRLLGERGFKNLFQVVGEPRDARMELERMEASGVTLQVVAGNETTAGWLVFADLKVDFPCLGNPVVLKPRSHRWPNFLKRDNLLNITNQIAVIAIIAVGMTVVIISGGIDLSVGSLIALSAVTACLLIQNLAGALKAGVFGMTLSCAAAILGSGLVGCFTGCMITGFGIPPFIVTLGVMMMASGFAYLLSGGESVYQVPDSFVWLGREASFLGVPNAVFLMVLLYWVAHVMMSKTKLGRYFYAVGGNAEAARLSGVPVRRVRLLAYSLCGLLAGLGGVVMASQLKSGAPTYGQMYELYVIAAVVVGGTSLSGGEGRIFGTLIGAFIIAVIQNGMNLMNVESYTQKVVLGAVILVAVLLDKLKQGGFRTR
jgi:ribose transport system permease protein